MYDELRRQYYLPIPSLIIIKKWLRNFKFCPGIQMKSLDVLRATDCHETSNTPVILVLESLCLNQNGHISSANELLKPGKRAAKEAFVETSEEIHYGDRKMAEVDENQFFVQHILVRALYSSKSWELPIFIELNKTGVKKNVLFQLISELEIRTSGRVKVAAILLDTQNNTELIDDLGLNEEVHSFSHPTDSHRFIYCFADTITLLHQQIKCILDHSILINGEPENKNGPHTGTLQRSDLEEAIKKLGDEDLCTDPNLLDQFTNKEYEPNYKLRELLISKNILTRSIANALESLYPDKYLQAEWIRTWGDYILLLTQEAPSNDLNVSERIINILDKMTKAVRSTRASKDNALAERSNNRRSTLHAFQKAIIWTIRSIKALYEDIERFTGTCDSSQDQIKATIKTIMHRLNLHNHDEKFHKDMHQTTDNCQRENSGPVSDVSPGVIDYVSNNPSLYPNLLQILTSKESVNEKRRGIKRSGAAKAKKVARTPSPPPTNPSTILEYKLLPEGKVFIPFGHPQVNTIQDKGKIEIVSKEPQIKIVYPDDPENSLLMLQQTNYMDQSSILHHQVIERSSSIDMDIQDNSLQEAYSPSNATVVIRQAVDIENSLRQDEMIKRKHSKHGISNSSCDDTVDDSAVHMNHVDIVDTEGNINGRYYIH